MVEDSALNGVFHPLLYTHTGSPRPSYGGHGPGPDASGYGMMFSQAAMQQHTAGSPGDYFNRVQTGKQHPPTELNPPHTQKKNIHALTNTHPKHKHQSRSLRCQPRVNKRISSHPVSACLCLSLFVVLSLLHPLSSRLQLFLPFIHTNVIECV